MITVAKRQSARRKSAAKQKDPVSTAKRDAKNFAKSVVSFIPGIGTLLGIQDAYNDGMKLLESAPQALKEIGNKNKERLKNRIENRIKERFKRR